MGYETKVILRMLYEAASRCETLEEALAVIASAANVEEVIVEPRKEAESK